MKTTKLLTIAFLLCMGALSANAQTVTRSLMLKPAGSAFTTSIDLTGSPTASWSLSLPALGDAAAAGPFMKVGIAAGNKTVSFGQMDLTSNGAGGDLTGVLGVTNGGTGLATLTAGSILLGNGTGAMNSLAVGTNGQVLSMVAGAPAWITTVAIANGGTNSAATPTNGGVAYGNGTQYQFSAAGTAGQVLQSNGAAAPTWISVNSFISGITFQYTVIAADQTAGYTTITPGGGFSLTSKVIVTYQNATGPAQAVTIGNQTATTFRVYSGAMTTGDLINYIIVN